MLENTNKAIAVNSIYLYLRMGLTTLCSLLTTRFALSFLGTTDFGLFSILGGIISLITIFNTIMLSSSNRFMSVSIGIGDDEQTARVFSVNMTLFIAIAIFTVLISYPLGHWYIYNHLNYDGNLADAMFVFIVSILGSIISSLGIPYNSVLIAKEVFSVFCLADIVSHLIRLGVAYLLIDCFNHKLIIYAATLAIMTAAPTLVYYLFCRKRYREISRFRIVRDKSLYKEICSFSGWVAYGAFACVARTQGAALLINGFFSTVMNTALGIANSIGTYVSLFAQNATQPMFPQITKSYSSGNYDRMEKLMVMSTKVSFMVTSLISIPFILAPEYFIGLWLGNIPDYVIVFTQLVIIDYLVNSFNSGLSNAIFASGNIKFYQIVINTLRIVSIIVGYFFIKESHNPKSILFVYIIFSVLIVVSTQWALSRAIHFGLKKLVISSYLPSLMVVILFLPILLVKGEFHPLLLTVMAEVYLIILFFLIELSAGERTSIIGWCKMKLLHRSDNAINTE